MSDDQRSLFPDLISPAVTTPSTTDAVRSINLVTGGRVTLPTVVDAVKTGSTTRVVERLTGTQRKPKYPFGPPMSA